MMGFLKTIGYGVLYTILSPLILLVLVLYAVYCFGLTIYEALRTLIIFFKGGTPFGDLAEDVKAKEILLAKQNAQLNPQPAMPQSQNIFIIQGANVQPGTIAPDGTVLSANQLPNNNVQPLPQKEPELIDGEYQELTTGGKDDNE